MFTRKRFPLQWSIRFIAAVCILVTASGVLIDNQAAGASYPDNEGQPVAFGDAASLGPSNGLTLNHPDVGMASTPGGLGYWIVASDGGVFSFGNAQFWGSTGAIALNKPIVGMAATPDGGGYWLVASDGGVFAFGDAQFWGSTGAMSLNKPIVGMAATPDGKGYWLVASDGGVFSFGDAKFWGSTGAIALNKPIVDMATTPDGDGYWLVASDGGVFAFGDAPYLGSTGGSHLDAPIVGIAATSNGYWLAAADGGVFAFGNAPFEGSMAGQTLTDPITAIAATPDGGGYWLLPTVPPPPPPTLGLGASGANVLLLQQKLTALGYWLGTPNGSFADSTQQALWALQKAAGLPRTGTSTPAAWAALDAGVVPHPQSTSGYVIEIDLADDLLMVVSNGHLLYTLNTSTGGGYTYTEDGATDVAITPSGHFTIERQVDGLVVDSLGALWMPKFFTGGYAIHGDGNVPPEPVSHGCARISNEAIDWVWADNIAPLGTAVWVY
ncbi:MAG TPA: L,D-transpeptidase family protein [Acidimicrobiales bacterium]